MAKSRAIKPTDKIESARKRAVELVHAIKRAETNQSTAADQQILEWAEGKSGGMTAIRWSIESAAAEFGLNPRTVSARVKQAGVAAGTDARFSTADIHRAICGDLEAERLRKTREEANKIALDNARVRGELLDLGDFMRWWEGKHVELKQIVMGSKELSDTDKDALLNKLREPYSVPGGQAAAQPEAGAGG